MSSRCQKHMRAYRYGGLNLFNNREFDSTISVFMVSVPPDPLSDTIPYTQGSNPSETIINPLYG